MHDLRLVGVHEDGEHLVLADADGERHLLAVDDSLRAAVRRDRPHLGQLQIQIEGGLRPRDVQMRIRAGASAEEVAALAGWTVEKVRRYEGPVLAERAHIAGLAQSVTLRRRSEQVTLGSEVTRRLAGRGVDPARIRWDSWRVDGDPWTVVVAFAAGGRDRTARWQFDLANRSVTPGDDEARWLSEDQPEGEGPLAGARLTSVPLDGLLGTAGSGRTDRHQVYDLEVDGGLEGPSARPAPGSDRAPEATDPLDLMTAMRSRRQGRHGHRGPTGATGESTHPAGRQRQRVDPAAGSYEHDGAPSVGSTLPPDGIARRDGITRSEGVEPLDLDPTLMDNPPAAHPRPDDVPEGEDTQGRTTLDPSLKQQARRTTPRKPIPSAGRPGHWPLTDAMRPSQSSSVSARLLDADLSRNDHDATGQDEQPAMSVGTDQADDPQPADGGADGRHRGDSASRRSRRSSVPSWDDIMFGTRKD